MRLTGLDAWKYHHKTGDSFLKKNNNNNNINSPGFFKGF